VRNRLPARAMAEPPTARGRVLRVADDVKERGYCGGFCGELNRDGTSPLSCRYVSRGIIALDDRAFLRSTMIARAHLSFCSSSSAFANASRTSEFIGSV